MKLPTANRQRQDDALNRIARAAGDRLEELSLSDYRLLRERAEEDLPAPHAVWAMFGSFQRMRDLALLRSESETEREVTRWQAARPAATTTTS